MKKIYLPAIALLISAISYGQCVDPFTVELQIEKNTGCDKFGATSATVLATPTDAVMPITYSWNDPMNQTSQAAVGLNALSEYCVTLTDGTGCTVNSCITVPHVIEINVLAMEYPTCDICGDGSITVEAVGENTPFTYRWNDDWEQTTKKVTGINPGEYTITITDSVGCFRQEKVVLPLEVGVEDPEVSPFNVYPNPASDLLSITASNNVSDYTVRIMDVSGRKIESFSLNGSQSMIDLSSYKSGVYVLSFQENSKNTFFERILISN